MYWPNGHIQLPQYVWPRSCNVVVDAVMWCSCMTALLEYASVWTVCWWWQTFFVYLNFFRVHLKFTFHFPPLLLVPHLFSSYLYPRTPRSLLRFRECVSDKESERKWRRGGGEEISHSENNGLLLLADSYFTSHPLLSPRQGHSLLPPTRSAEKRSA